MSKWVIKGWRALYIAFDLILNAVTLFCDMDGKYFVQLIIYLKAQTMKMEHGQKVSMSIKQIDHITHFTLKNFLKTPATYRGKYSSMATKTFPPMSFLSQKTLPCIWKS